MWGDRDGVIPVEHAYAAHELIPNSRLEVLEGVGHFLPIERSDDLADLIADFLATTEPANVSESRWQDLLTTATATPVDVDQI